MGGTAMLNCVEDQIREAMERGDFDNLEGKDKPIDLSDYFRTPEELRAGYRMVRNAGFKPAELELQQEIILLERKRDQLRAENRLVEEIRKIESKIRDRKLELAIQRERRLQRK